MEQIGYSLVDASGHEVWHVGNIKGQIYLLPDTVPLPNGDQVHCAKAGDQLGEWKLVERWIDDSPPSRWHSTTGSSVAFDGTKVVVTVSYGANPSIVPQT